MSRTAKQIRQSIEGMNLKRLRSERGWTQDDLAGRIQTDKRYISMIEKGNRGIGADMMERLCRVFEVTEAEFSKGAMSGPLHDNPYINQFLTELISEFSAQSETEILRKIADLKETLKQKE